MRTLNKLLFFVSFILTLNTTQAFDNIDGINITISMENTYLKNTDSILIRTTFHNTTLNDIKLLKWNTPLEGLFHADFFSVQDIQQKDIPYTGKLLKRLPAKTSDYITLKAGESISRILNLSDAYQLKKAGFYTVSYRFNNTNTLGNKLGFTLLDDRFEIAQKQFKQALYSSCSTSRQKIINKVLPEASKLATLSTQLLKTITEDDRANAERYTNWFGEYDYDRYDTVLSNFKAIKNTLDNKKIIFKCDCQENAIAFVFPNKPFEIHICPTFWELQLNGTDSQAGTLIHELSHFKAIAHTDDYVYGKIKAHALAKSNPDDATNNADNYEYFAENNNPYIAMYSDKTADSYEPNNYKKSAKFINANNPQVHSIHSKDDTDWLKFELQSKSYINIHLMGPDGGDTSLTLYNEAGEKIAYNDDINSTEQNNYSEISKDYLDKGIYTIKVNGYNTKVQEYQMTLTILGEGSSKNNNDSHKSSSGSFYWPFLLLLLLSGFLRKRVN